MMEVAPGDAVLTKNGAGVVVRVLFPEGTEGGGGGEFEWVEGWKGPGTSLASCTLTTLRKTDVVRRLVAAPGTIVRVVSVTQKTNDNGETDDEAVANRQPPPTRLFMIEKYLESTDVYVASPVDNNEEWGGDGATVECSHCHLLAHQIMSSSSKFYPMLVDLIDRGEAAWTATMDTNATLSTVAANVMECVSTVADNIESVDSKELSELVSGASKSLIRTIDEKVVDGGIVPSSTTIDLPLPQTEEVKRIYEMMRDNDLMELFHGGRRRLMVLIEEEIPERTRRTLVGMGIELEDEESVDDDAGNGGGTANSMRRMIEKMRKEALSSLDEMMKTHVDSSNGVRKNAAEVFDTTSTTMAEAQRRFAVAFDGLSKAAISDPQLSSIFCSISEKTRTWQEMTGRLLQTRTASLFVEGAQRLTARAAELLNPMGGALALGGMSGDADLTRAFTEGDVAKAKLKSMEMGDAVRKRLFAAIELRSECSGGLDAIIAGSLAQAHQVADGCGSKAASLLAERQAVEGLAGDKDCLQNVVAELRRTATSAMRGTKESLIALLSTRSVHRDVALLRLERTLIDLESQLGRNLTADQIAGIASGEGGSMALFEPIATRAAKEIEIQLDAAEAKMRETEHWSTNADDVMTNVRKITRGELGIVDLLDVAATYLDDEDVVTKSGGLIVKAENFLDTIEAASARLGGELGKGDAASAGIMNAVAKAGITKRAVMRGVEGLDMNKFLDDTHTAITDDNARRELISSAGDSALDFLLKILPEMPVPPFDGVREGLVYHLSNLSMAGFKVKKEDVCIEIAGMRAAAPQSSSQPTARAIKASELLIIDIRNISATLDDAVWSFEQTYMPYLKGSGKANTKLWDGAIRLKFELRKRVTKIEVDPNTGEETKTWEPVLCLNDRSCSIGGVELTIQGESRITWVANKLTSLLGAKLRDYLVIVIINALTNNSARLIDMLNSNLCKYWDFIMKTAKLNLDQLPDLEEHHVTKAAVGLSEDLVELVWRERVPLGLNLLTNDSSGLLKVIDLPRGTQARQVAQGNQLDPDIFKGATIVAVNGRRYGPDSQVELFVALKDPARPKAILFKLSKSLSDLERIDRIIRRKDGATDTDAISDEAHNKVGGVSGLVATVKFVDEGSIGVRLTSHDSFALAVKLFLRGSSGEVLPVEESGMVMVGDLLSHINGTLLLGAKGEGKQKAYSLLEQVGKRRPLSLGFVKPYQYSILVERNKPENESFGGPSELEFVDVGATTTSKEKTIILKGYALAEGAAETGGVLVGDNLVFINGFPVGAGCRLLSSGSKPPTVDEVSRMLKQYSPLALGFARAQAKQTTVKAYMTSSPLSLDIETAHSFSVEASDYNHLGCLFVTGMNGTDIVVKDIVGVEGPFQQQMVESKQPFVGCKLQSVDGEVVPSYANSQLIVSVMKRRWAANGRVELIFCDEKQRDALTDMICSDSTQDRVGGGR